MPSFIKIGLKMWPWERIKVRDRQTRAGKCKGLLFTYEP